MKTTKALIVLTGVLTTFSAFASSPQIRCWGSNAQGQLDVPAGIQFADEVERDPLLVRVTRSLTCELTKSHRIKCWGMRMQTTAWLESLTDVTDFALGAIAACAVTNQKVVCRSEPKIDALENPPAMTGVRSLSVTANTACAVHDGGLSCWGSDDFGWSLLSVPKLKKPVFVRDGHYQTCALDGRQVKCWGIYGEKVPEFRRPQDVVSIAGMRSCVLDADGLSCWYENGDKVFVYRPKGKAQLASTMDSVCVLDESGLRCFVGYDFNEVKSPLGPLKRPRAIYGGPVAGHFCALDDDGLKCGGEDSAGQSSFSALESLSAGAESTCALAKSKAYCWGKKTLGSDALPEDALYGAVAVGSTYACAIGLSTPYSAHMCWGPGASIVSQSPSSPLIGPTSSYSYNEVGGLFISAGYRHICTRFNNVSSTVCWGANDYGQTKVPQGYYSETSVSTPIAAGGNHTCGIDGDKKVVCWGRNDFGQSTPPPTVEAKQVVAGQAHSCVLDKNGVACWGRNGEGQTKVPPLKNPRAISAGGYHTCAVDDDGVKCWGENGMGQTKVPTDLPARTELVSAGMYHTCVAGR